MTLDDADDLGKWPYYPMYPRDFLADALLLTETEELMYRRLLDYQWLQRSVPATISDLAAASRLSKGKASKAWPKLAEHFPVWPDGVRRNRRLERERTELETKRKKRSAAGKEGADKRWGKDSNANSSANADAITSECHADTDADPDAEAFESSASPHDAFLALVPAETRPDVAALFRSAHNPDAVLRSLVMIVEGGTPPAYDHATIGKAIQEMAATGGRFSVNGLRAFCRNLGGSVSRRTAPNNAKPSPEQVRQWSIDAQAAQAEAA